MEALYCMSAICFLIGLICLFLSLWSRDPKHLGSAVGTLANSKKVMRRAYRYSDKKISVTTSVYRYQVNGKTYRLKHDGRFGRSTLMRRVTVVYLKGFPRFGYLEKYPSGIFTMLGIFYLLAAAWLLLVPYW